MDIGLVFAFDESKPMARVVAVRNVSRGESRNAHQALLDNYAWRCGLREQIERYKQQTLNKDSTKPPTVSITSIGQWSTWYAWEERKNLQKLIDQEAERQMWLERRTQARELDWTQGEKLRDLADKVIKEAPNFVKEWASLEDGTLVKYKALSADALVKVAKLASDLQRLASGMETGRIGVDLSKSADELTDEELAEIIRRHGGGA
jgi:hypothetical protein